MAQLLGVYKGEFAKYINYFFSDRKIYLFDTFSGFNKRDITFEEEFHFSNSSEGEYYNDSIQLVLDKMVYKQNCIIKKGCFPKSTVGVEDIFCFVSLDIDLYKPIHEGLIYFYKRLIKGGYIMIHDYSSTRFDGVKKAVRQFAEEKGVNYYPVMDLGGSVILCK
ncbi:macrocin-O-methyltransferase TylF [Mobilisporobacter senegalensis]|uniref:Macrocin-O-methyltransferase TylF n=1 Tax=Mobilisporobacter senegalensis TaxID=1329262 RepID=A0A3N1XY47_9FIRM|nr:TylF/MycF/NovP-related O-methyltransferase [Mobilisporobacter senegalensis]ROR31535.1 macrocin-O-methyltransferase TylF [Mobilisporobacter senegalensis]